jgi:predicted nucleic acid-binding protein
MAQYLLDTNVIVEFSKGRGAAFTLVNHLIEDGEQLGTCAIVVAEFLSGVAASDRPIWRQFFDNMDYWPIDLDVAVQAAESRYTFARQGIQLSTADALIAAVAYVESATLVTHNVNHFPMTDITVLVPKLPDVRSESG